MRGFSREQEYYEYLRSLGGFPSGFRSSTASLQFQPSERSEPYSMNVSLLMSDAPCSAFAGLFTQNAVCGFPVRIGRERVGRGDMQAVLVNNRIANVAVAGGLETAQRLCERAGKRFGIDGEAIFPSSTGIIGWRLPVAEMLQAIDGMPDPAAASENVIAFAQSIMTTDSYPKVHVRRLGKGRILGIAKGAGMIEPNMATMLVFILTDIRIERSELRRSLAEAANASFNCISIDGDQSTSDMLLAFSSQKYEADAGDFSRSLSDLCRDLSRDIVRNGEGTGHVIEISVASGRGDSMDGAQVELGAQAGQGGSATQSEQARTYARSLARAVGNSPLVKTAIYGNDPNVGRILSALGDEAGRLGRSIDLSKLSIRIGSDYVFRGGSFELSKEKEAYLSNYLKAQAQNPRIQGYPQHDRCVRIYIDLDSDAGEDGGAERESGSWRESGSEREQSEAVYSYGASETVIASDLGHEYVSENADYRS